MQIFLIKIDFVIFLQDTKVNSISKDVNYYNVSKNKGKIFIYMGISQIEKISKPQKSKFHLKKSVNN